MTHDLIRRDRRGRPVRRLAHRHAAGPQGLPGAGRRPGHVPERHPLDPLIHAPGVAALQRWGLLDQVIATGCPPIESYSFDFGPFTISGSARPTDGIATAYGPRRTVLDKILVDAAAAAGAEVREGFTVEEVIVEDGAVVGIRGHDAGGTSVVERARVVIGADGRNSHVAQGREARAVQREADAPVELLHVLERPPGRRRSRPSSVPIAGGRCFPRTTA